MSKTAFLIFLIGLSSCSNPIVSLVTSKSVAENVIADVRGSGGNIFFTELRDNKTGTGIHYIQLNIKNCKLLEDTNMTKALVASYCATQLYLRLDSEIIKANSAINIVFDDEMDILNKREFYYKKEELESACKAFDNVNKYLNLLHSNKLTDASDLIDTSYFVLDVNNLNTRVKNKLGSSDFTTVQFYEYYEYSNKDSTKHVPCFSVSAMVTKTDSSQTSFAFLIPIYESNNKIIDLQPQD